jgi:RNA polymerase sigma-70 factor (ECF subfamily)
MNALMTKETRSIQEFEGWVKEHQSGLRAFIRALGADEAWVDDLAQEAFIVAYRRLDDFEPGTDFAKWLRGIARNLVANERRKESRRSRLLPHAVADVLLERMEEDDPMVGDPGRLIPLMRECMSILSARSKELLQRRYATGENASRLARELNMNSDTVRQILLRARVAMKECIDKKSGGIT